MARAIDADKLLEQLQKKKCGPANKRYTEGFNDCLMRVRSMVHSAPTLTPPNEWVKVMEAINNAAVAYMEGGPYENDLPGMEFALKIDRLSRDFVRPPEGEEDT